MSTNIKRLLEKVAELEGRIVELENLTVIGDNTYRKKKERKVKVSGVPYKVDIKDIFGGGA